MKYLRYALLAACSTSYVYSMNQQPVPKRDLTAEDKQFFDCLEDCQQKWKDFDTRNKRPSHTMDGRDFVNFCGKRCLAQYKIALTAQMERIITAEATEHTIRELSKFPQSEKK